MKYQLLFILSVILICCQSKPNQLYQWRGENRTGLYPDTNLLDKWPEEGPTELWSIDHIGQGYSSPVFVEDRFFVCGEIDSMANLFCFSLDGKEIWRTILGKEWVKTYSGSRSTPTVVGDLVYVGSGLGDLYCVEKAGGKVVWSMQSEKEFEGTEPLHGHSESPVVYNNKVFWNTGGKNHNVVAINRYTGKMIWSNPGLKERPGYNQGQLIKLPERAIYVTFSAYFLMGFDTETGELLWSQEQTDLATEERTPGMSDGHMNSVLFQDGNIYYSSAVGRGGVCLRLSEDGSEIKKYWRNPNFGGLMGGIVIMDDFIYGSTYFSTSLMSVELSSGLTVDSLKLGRGAVIAADSMLYYYTQKGELKLIQSKSGKLQEISSFRISKGTNEHFAHPVIFKGVLYQRRGQSLVAYNLKN